MGGQTADHGRITDSDSIENPDGNCALLFRVNNVQKNKGGKFMHYGKLLKGSLKVGDTVAASIDTVRRAAIDKELPQYSFCTFQPFLAVSSQF